MAWFSSIGKFFGFGGDKPSSAAIVPTKTLGHGGTAVFGGYLDSKEKSPDLRGSTKYRTFDELKINNDVVGTAVRRIGTLVKGATWRLEPPADSGAEGERIAEALHSILLAPRAMRRPWSRIVARQFMHVWDGAAISEWIAKRRDDGLVGIDDIQPRPMQTITRWDVATDGTLLGVTQQSPWTGEEIPLPRGKLVYNVDADLTDSPDGTGYLRHIAETTRRTKRYRQIEGWNFEIDLGGTPVAYIPYAEIGKITDKPARAAAEAEVDGIEKFLEQRVITPGRGLTLESKPYQGNVEGTPGTLRQYDVKLLPSGVSSFEHVAAAIEREDRAIARLLGIEGLMLGGDGKGSYSLSKDKTAALAQLITSGLDSTAEALDQDVVSVLMVLNGWPKALTPRLIPSSVQLTDVAAICDALESIARAALDPRDPAVTEVRGMVGISPIPDDLLDEIEADAALRREQPGAPVGFDLVE